MGTTKKFKQSLTHVEHVKNVENACKCSFSIKFFIWSSVSTFPDSYMGFFFCLFFNVYLEGTSILSNISTNVFVIFNRLGFQSIYQSSFWLLFFFFNQFSAKGDCFIYERDLFMIKMMCFFLFSLCGSSRFQPVVSSDGAFHFEPIRPSPPVSHEFIKKKRRRLFPQQPLTPVSSMDRLISSLLLNTGQDIWSV